MLMQDINNIRFSYARARPRQAPCGPPGRPTRSTAMSDTEPARACPGGRLARTGARIARLIGTIEMALQVRRERRILLAMDDRMLKDLGLNGIAHKEAVRPF